MSQTRNGVAGRASEVEVMAILFVGSIGLDDDETRAMLLRSRVGFIAGRSEDRFGLSKQRMTIWLDSQHIGAPTLERVRRTLGQSE
jgi:hypothetical protein